MRSYTELEKTVATFSSCHPTTEMGRKEGPPKCLWLLWLSMTCKEWLGQLCLLSWVKRRSHSSPQGLEGNLQEDKPFLVVPDNPWSRGGTMKFLLRRLGLAFRKRCFFLQESGATLKGTLREATKPGVLWF